MKKGPGPQGSRDEEFLVPSLVRVYEFNKVAVAVASCDHQKSKLRAVVSSEGFWVAKLRVRQLKIKTDVKNCIQVSLSAVKFQLKFFMFLLDNQTPYRFLLQTMKKIFS